MECEWVFLNGVLFFSMYWWISSREVFICADYLYLFLKCLLPTSVEMAGASERHLYNTNDTSSDTEDYTDDRRRRVFKSRVRYVGNIVVWIFFVENIEQWKELKISRKLDSKHH